MTANDAPTNGVSPDLLAGRHPSTVAICGHFGYGHLAHELQLVSMPFAQLVEKTLRNVPDDSAELTAGLRKILEGKDCVVRAALVALEQ
jgi:hypothetical protein